MKIVLICIIEETIVSLKELFRRAEETLGIPVNKVILIVPSYYAEFIMTEGSVKVSNEEGVVTNEDITNVLSS